MPIYKGSKLPTRTYTTATKDNGIWTWEYTDTPGAQSSEAAQPDEPTEESPPLQYNANELNQSSLYLKERLMKNQLADSKNDENWMATEVAGMKHICHLTDQKDLMPGLANKEWSSPKEAAVAFATLWSRSEQKGLLFGGAYEFEQLSEMGTSGFTDKSTKSSTPEGISFALPIACSAWAISKWWTPRRNVQCIPRTTQWMSTVTSIIVTTMSFLI